MSTATRLAAYYTAEAETLKAQSLGKGDRNIQRAQLETIRAGIKELEAQLASESLTESGQRGPAVLLGGFTNAFGSRTGQ